MERDDKINHLKKKDIENNIWDFVFDIKTNPERYEEQAKEEINAFYKAMIEKNVTIEILLPLKNIELKEDIIFADFQLKVMDETIFNEWASKSPWGHFKETIGSVILLTQVDANSGWKAVQRGKSKCLAYISTLQILPRHYKVGKIEPDGFIYSRIPNSHRCGWSRLDEINWVGSYPEKFDIEHINNLSNLIINNQNDLTNRLIASIKLLAEADTDQDLRFKIIKSFMALETILIGKNEKNSKKFKIMFRISLFYSRLEKGFPTPETFPFLYDKRNDFIHQVQEKDISKAELEYLQQNIDSMIYWTDDIILELMKFLNGKPFKSHKSFLNWLLKKDGIHESVIDWYKSIGWKDIHKLK